MSAPKDKPAIRKLQGYAFDPSLSLLIDTAEINRVIYEVDWESTADEEDDGPFGPGPVGEYLEVIDIDPPSNTCYTPVDLNHPYILAEDGLAPSESNPQFHQQMVYAVAMVTIKNFERALGRKIIWSSRLVDTEEYEKYVSKLRLYPHALREANAYYSPLKKAVLFGYFSAGSSNPVRLMPKSHVFTCLSHDIIAHEVTHAILDGLHRNYNLPTNPDVLAFHEAFADLVALFQHFTFPEVLRHQLARTKGDLEKQSLLGELAQQVGVALGHSGSLRQAIGGINPETGNWELHEPDPADYERTQEPHARGSILVAAVFEAFMTIYKERVRDLLRIASGGSGILPEGEIQPDLIGRLATEASKTAHHVLAMCVRALDYCPPVDITFGDYLRAIITADYDLVDSDPHHYRLAFINAFRRRGIYPDSIKTLSEDSLRYPKNPEVSNQSKELLNIIDGFLRDYRKTVMDITDRKRIWEISRNFIKGGNSKPEDGPRHGLHKRLRIKFDNSFDFERLTGLVFNNDWRRHGIDRGDGNMPSFQILDLRLVSRVGPDGNQVNQIVFGLLQRMKGYLYEGAFTPKSPYSSEPPLGREVEIQGGSTIIYDLDTQRIKYAIAKPLLDPEKLKSRKREVYLERILKQQRYVTQELSLHAPELSQYFGMAYGDDSFGEPFSLLHSH